MNKDLPSRPNLDHLRRQAKALLAGVTAGDADAIRVFREHLPSAKGMSADQIRTASFRLADAQSAVARKTGFSAWPQLARHVQILRNLEGSWTAVSTEIEGNTLPAQLGQSARLLMDGDRFRTESPDATYEGIFNINVDAEPHQIDIEFIAGPEAGNWNYGIFSSHDNELKICLDMTGRGRPAGFTTTPGSGHAFQIWRRESADRPNSVTGGTRITPPSSPAPVEDKSAFTLRPSETLTRLQGEWSAERVVRDGQEMMWIMRKTGNRSAAGNEVKITFMGQLIIHALVRIDESASPVAIDYYNLAGPATDRVTLGIMEWQGDNACFCMAPPGQPRPADFECPPASGRTLSVWKPRKK